PIEVAGEIARLKGKVVVVGRIKMHVPRDIYYEKELDLRLSMSYGPGRYDKEFEEKGHDYPYGYVRWTEKRNMESFLTLVAHGKIDVNKLITHRFKIDEAMKAYDMIMNNTKPYLGVILEYNTTPEAQSKNLDKRTFIRPTSRPSAPTSQLLNVGIIGCGNYARGVLIPKIKEIHGVNIKAICTERGVEAKSVADSLKCSYCVTDYKEILSDQDIDTIIIATRHNTHAEIVINSLNAGKHVFVEKPLALRVEELNDIVKTYQPQSNSDGHILTVGFNRRFSPHTEVVLDHFKKRKNPLVMNCRVNAGPIARDHWVQDYEEGGGRIIGEVCHFIDLFQFISRAEPTNVYARQIGSHTSGVTNDNVLVTIEFSDGSIGSISYIASGDTALPKERIEIFGDGKVAVMNDFKRTELYANNKRKLFKTKNQDKGHKRELSVFFNAVTNGKKAPITFESLYLTTLTSFKIRDSLNMGLAIELL
ncbi:MAG: Gfo/Idh/MocA family oxidoreductase, partial [Candidatus Hodarchaeota archaeon]